MSLALDHLIASPIHFPMINPPSVARTASKSVRKSMMVNPVFCISVMFPELQPEINWSYRVMKVFAKT